MHERTGIPLVATNDIHYLRAEDCHAQDVLLCINTGAKKLGPEPLQVRDRQPLLHVARGDGPHVP